MATPHKIKAGKVTRKLAHAAPAGLGTAGTLALVISYYVAKFDPEMPVEIVTALATTASGFLVAVVMAAVAFFTRPSPDDVPVPDLDAARDQQAALHDLARHDRGDD
jgi:cation transporter-like permease